MKVSSRPSSNGRGHANVKSEKDRRSDRNGHAYGHEHSACRHSDVQFDESDAYSQDEANTSDTASGYPSASHGSAGLYRTTVSQQTPGATGNVPASTAYSSQWVQIPYPLSSFYPSLPAAPPTQSEGTGAADKAKPDSDSKDKSAMFQASGPAVSGWLYFGSTQLREDTVESVNEAGDAIWKNTRPAPLDDSNSEDL